MHFLRSTHPNAKKNKNTGMRETEAKQKMSTKIKKLYSSQDIKQAQSDLIKVERYFTRNTKKRKTVQVRISEKWHKKLKEVAIDENILLSFMLDEICKQFFKNHY